MRKNWWKKAAGMGLALAMAMGLSGCGGESNVNSGLAKEGVSRFQEIEIPDMEADYMNVAGTGRRDGRIYLMLQLEHWSNGSENRDVRVVSMKEDGTDIKVVSLDIPQQESTGGGGGAVPMPRTTESSMPVAEDVDSEDEEGEGSSEDGAATDSEDTGAEEDSAIDTPIDEPIIGGEDNDFWENSYYGNFILASDGSVYSIKNYNYERYGEEYYSIRKYYLCKWNSEDGSQLAETELVLTDPDKEDEWVGVNTMTVGADGNVYIILSGEVYSKIVVDASGNVSQKQELSEDTAKVFNNLDRVIAKEDGTLLALYYDENDYQKMYMADYDPATDTIGQPVSMPSFLTTKGFNVLMVGVSSDLVYCDNNGVYSFNIGDEAPTLRMSFINSDLDISYFNGLVEIDENTFIGIYNDNYKDDMNFGLFTHVDPKDIPDKNVLVLAANYVPYDMKRRVVEFNRASEEYRIVLKEYQEYNTYEDWNAGVTQLNNDITTGKMPDILIGSGLPMENYAAKGLLADVGELIQEDEELSKIQFVQNVFDAYSVKDTLYYVIPSFNVRTMIAKTSLVGDRTEWTMKDAQEVLAGMQEGAQLFGETTRDSYFSTAMTYCAGDFIDVATGKCDFNSERFISMMEYAKSLPQSLDEDYYGEDYWATYQSQYRDNRTLLLQIYINSIRDLNYNINGRMGEDVSYVGFPMEGGQGAVINATQIYAISAKSNFKEGAWEFLRYYLTDEYQAEMEWNLSVHMDRFKENANLATEKPFYIDENGDKQEYDETFYMNGESITIPPMTQEQVDKAVNYILSLKKSGYDNTNVMNIINEEMGGFFTGQKSAQEVAAVIQNRVQLYVDENR